MNKMAQNREDKQIVSRDILKLRPWARNARKHSKKQIRQIADSIEEFGFTNPVLVDQDDTILAGHGRVEAAKLLGWTTVPCLEVEHMSAAQKRAYVLADNKLALNASWDEELLSEELAALSEIDLDFDIGLTGFSISEVDNLLDLDEPEQDQDPRHDTLPLKAPARVSFGQVWALGPHRLVCGNSLDAATVSNLMDGKVARMVFADPPYNVPVDGHVGGSGKLKHREFAMATGEMTAEEFVGFLGQTFTNLITHAADGSIHFICMDWRHMGEVLAAAEGKYSELKNLIVWIKERGGMGTFYRSRHELIFAFKQGNAEHINSFELGQHGRYRTNVWEYKAASQTDLQLHPTVKPVLMIADAMRDVSGRGDVVLDLFGGSGSTLIAAEKTGRTGYLCEIDPAYCDIILARWEALAKDEAVCLGSLETAVEVSPETGGANA